jgi:hypothetical protein
VACGGGVQRFKPVFGHPIRCDLGQGRVEFEDVFEVELEWRNLGLLAGV